MVKRKKFSSYTRETVAYRQSWKCNTCEETLKPSFHIDHKKPLFTGGSNGDDNLQALCYSCHTSKSAFEQRLAAAKAKEKRSGRSMFFDVDSYFFIPQCKRRKQQ